MARLLRFVDRQTDTEFVVIDTTEMTDVELEAEYMAELRDSRVLYVNVDAFPTDRALEDS